MGLLDLFRRQPTPNLDHERRLIQLESRHDTLREEWVDFKDIIRKQADRVEKREQRAKKKSPCDDTPLDEMESIQDRILARRRVANG